jgi:hypothetical protein
LLNLRWPLRIGIGPARRDRIRPSIHPGDSRRRLEDDREFRRESRHQCSRSQCRQSHVIVGNSCRFVWPCF